MLHPTSSSPPVLNLLSTTLISRHSSPSRLSSLFLFPPALLHGLGPRSLATLGRLKDRHIEEVGICGICNSEEESIIHAIFNCHNVRDIWELSPFASLVHDSPGESFLRLIVTQLYLVSHGEINQLGS